MEMENVNFKDEKRAKKNGDKPSWGNCTADEAFAVKNG
jgi:hypothetical protein